jgi:hypothetical protein
MVLETGEKNDITKIPQEEVDKLQMTRVVDEMERAQIAQGFGEWPRPRTGKLKVVV